MWFGVLGSLQVIAGNFGGPGTISATRLRVLLAVLLWRANQPVSADEIAELVWDGAPPAGAPDAIRALVMRLRRRLDPRAAARIVTRAPGYAIEVTGDELDAARFEMLTRQAGAAVSAGRWAQASRTAAEALGLWRGTPLADISSQLLRDRWVPRLEQLHVQALDWRIEGDLHDGRHEQLIPELRDLTARYPLRENFHSRLMLALYRCGRQAEALAGYQRARDVLIAELGIEPGPGLRDLHQRILSADPVLIAAGMPGTAAAEGKSEPAVPRELPAAVPGFTGRSAELKELSRLLDRPAEQVRGTVVISAIGGAGGVGKTALAVHWAYQVAGRFPDGQLYVNLRGYDPGRPVPPADALAGFLRSLGVRGRDIPPETDERAARYRSLLAGKQMLIVLDNAGSADQVRPLLPGTPSCAVLVTSRDALAGLIVGDGAVRLDLDALPLEEAVALLRTLIGARVNADPEAAAELAGQCCRLPLALRVAAELAVSRPAVPMAGLTGELADVRTRLDVLTTGGDPRTEVRTVFSWSYERLDPDAARTFRMLGLHPGRDFDSYATAALTGATLPEACRALDELNRAHLLSAASRGRYDMHDLLRGYAGDLAATLDDGQERHEALTRMFDYYLHTAAVAMDLLFPAERDEHPRVSGLAAPVPQLPDAETARDWLDSERPTLVAVSGHAALNGWPDHATRLAITLSSYLGNGGYFPEALAIFGNALVAAHRTGDRAIEASALTLIGNVDWLQSRFPQASDHYRQALALSREAEDRMTEASALGGMGLCETALGDYEQAARHQQDVLVIYRDIGDRVGEARALGNLALARRLQGRYQEAEDYQQRLLALSREIGDREGEVLALSGLGTVNLRLGRYQEAERYLTQGLAICRETKNLVFASGILTTIGEVHERLGRLKEAADDFEQALPVLREVGDRQKEADALNGLGEVLLRRDERDKARGCHTAALRLASEAGLPQQQARAHGGLARVCDADGDVTGASNHWQEALASYDAIGAPEAGEIRARLAMMGGNGDDTRKPTGEGKGDRGTTVPFR
ncbi:MAG TPA: tetratricopeptide repeat protein [Trebonia sp.]|jgi:DNA-binding SARP family transcriptional activator/tetratricopeptide (TPR) repeat protein|nr:tetratricopeptide repeat protein [Trebonia sp.]